MNSGSDSRTAAIPRKNSAGARPRLTMSAPPKSSAAAAMIQKRTSRMNLSARSIVLSSHQCAQEADERNEEGRDDHADDDRDEDDQDRREHAGDQRQSRLGLLLVHLAEGAEHRGQVVLLAAEGDDGG